MDGTEHARTVALLHEEGLVCRAFGRLLRELAPYQLLAEAEDPAAFKRAFALGPPPTAVVLSQVTALKDECAMLHWLMKRMPTARIVVLGPQELPVCTLVRTVRAGAHGFCSTRTHDQLRSVLDVVCAGALAFPAYLVEYLRNHLPEPQETSERPLTGRERQILLLLSHPEHPTYGAIAEELHISVGRVKAICGRLRELHKVNGKSGLVLLGIRLGLVSA